YLGAGKAVLGTDDDVITGPTLSRLYGAEIDFVRIGGRVFVMSGDVDMESDPHRHEDGGHDHDHGGRRHGHAAHADDGGS
ncbi:MAG TPA: hypothetical protein VGY52_07750, partial [Roseiarcus sp.]|nr:hypothetical protein [Roseiarcus sp.]